MGSTMKVLLVLCSTLAIVLGYPTTVPNSAEVCRIMTPGHGPSPQKSTSPYTLVVSATQVKGGNNVQVTLEGNGNTFKGFYVQARDAQGNPIGTFIPDDGVVKVHGCGGVKNNAAHHSGKDDKEDVVVNWQAPKQYSGQVTFTATFVEEFETFWTNVKSEPVNIQIISNKSNFIDAREKRETSETTQEGRILSYNPYSPFSSLKSDGKFTSKQFVLSLLDRNLNSNETRLNPTDANEPRAADNIRTRKSYDYYIQPLRHPNPIPTDAVIVNDDIENCKIHSHKISISSSPHQYGPIHVPIGPQYSYPSYNKIPLVKTPTLTPVIGAGYQRLDPTQTPAAVKPYVNRLNSNSGPFPSRKVKFYDDSLQHPASFPNHHHHQNSYGFRPFQNSQPPTIYNSNNFGTTSGWTSTSTIAGGPYGVLTNQYGPTDTAIVLPKNMEVYDIPHYGYVIYNPTRGAPFYLIPADTQAFERVHFGSFERSSSSRRKL